MSQPVLRVLLVDDNADIRRLLGLRLSVEDDCTVVGEASNGEIALDLAGSLRPDVIVLDLSMPVMDGLEALPGLRALLPEARIIVLSGFDHRAFRAQAIDLGADEYVEKGTPLDTLVSLVRGPTGGEADLTIDLTAQQETPCDRPS